MSSGTISPTPIRFISPRSGAKTPEVLESERKEIEMIALLLIERRSNHPTTLWAYNPQQLKSVRRKSKKEVARRQAKLQLAKVARNRIVKDLHEFSPADYNRLIPRAVDLIFSNGWMEIVDDTRVVLEVVKDQRIKKGRHPQVQRRDHRLVLEITGLGRAAYGRWKAHDVSHPATGSIPTTRK